MKREKLKVDFKDERGSIMDVIEGRPFGHCVIITCKKGATRGNHFHKFSAQSDFIISGKFAMYGMKKGSKKIERFVVTKNDVTHWDKGEAHEFETLEDGVFLSFVKGPRGGNNYEKDTFRLQIPLHEQFKKKIIDWSVK